ncbi:MAG: RES family NAD+ phosphorylase [Gammaproteobacteria bacterium]|jgi:hypothetical protein|nr:RES family NAD+ phosphorylase [Gammaproteobacteria bacterium]
MWLIYMQSVSGWMVGVAGKESRGIPIRYERWNKAIRIIPSHFPPIDLFEEVADPADLQVVHKVEALTNPRLRDQLGNLSLVPVEDRISGPGSSPIMAAFTHPNHDGSRFSPGHYGVYYAASDDATAIAETRYHRERLLGYSAIGPQRVQMRAYFGAIEADWVDIRGLRQQQPDLYNPDSYSSSQAFGEQHQQQNAWGIAYNSVRRPQGQSLAVFRPRACAPVQQGSHYEYYYDGHAINHVVELTEIRN